MNKPTTKTFEQKVRDLLVRCSEHNNLILRSKPGIYSQEDFIKDILEAHAEEMREINEELIEDIKKYSNYTPVAPMLVGGSVVYVHMIRTDNAQILAQQIIDKKIGGSR